MWFVCRESPITWAKSLTAILVKPKERTPLYTFIRRRQTSFFGHIMLRNTLENIVTTGNITDRRGSDRPGELMLQILRM